MADGPTHWLYPTNEQGDYHLVNVTPGQPNLRVSPENVWAQIELDPDRRDTWYLSTGFRQMRGGDAVWLYAAGDQELYALARVAGVERDAAGDHHAVLLWDLEATRRLARAPISRSSFREVPQSVRRANSATVNVLNAWLLANELSVSDWEDPDAELSEGDARTRVLADIVRRQGQGPFRADLLAAYGWRCAVTGETTEDVLEAAHVSPYRGPATNTTRNGLLLRSDLHTLFDRHLIAVSGEGRLVVSSLVTSKVYTSLAGQLLAQPKRRQDRPSKRLLAQHLSRLRS